jgi:hypothetical protein
MIEIAPLAERICSLYAAADFKIELARQLEDGSVSGANAIQKRLNEADAYRSEAQQLISQARSIARRHGTSLPGIEGLRAIADQYAS